MQEQPIENLTHHLLTILQSVPFKSWCENQDLESQQLRVIHHFNPHPVVKKILTHVEMRGPRGPR